MAVVIDLQGEIGFHIRPKEISLKLSRVNGEDVIVRLSTIGGDVFDGADIVNMFLDFRRDNPSIKMSLEIKAIAASYGSALMSAGIWDSIGISRVSAFMMHNAGTFVYGDSQVLKSAMEFLDGLNVAYRALYSDQSGKTILEVTELMNAETWYFGQEIIDQGFADKIITMDDPGGDQLPLLDESEDRNIFIVDFKNQRESMMAKQKDKAKDEKFDIQRAIACLREPSTPIIKPAAENITMVNPGKPDENKPAPVGNLIMEVPMNEAELKKDNPELYASMIKKGASDERENNNVRVKALTEMKQDEDYKDMPEIIAVIDDAIMGSGTVDSVLPKINIAVMKIMKDPARMAALESPGAIVTGDGETVIPESKKNAEV